MAGHILDSYALLAYFRDEPGADKVEALLHKASKKDQPLHMTEVNYAEVQYMTLRKDGEAAWSRVSKALETLPIQFHPANRELADLAAGFKAKHKMSLADAFAAALAKAKNAELVTGDKEFRALGKEIKINFINEH